MSRFEKTPSVEPEEDQVEATFQKLYKRYVESDEDFSTHSNDEFSTKPSSSKSEAEDDDVGKLYNKLRRASSASSITPKPSPSATPLCSPMVTRKNLGKVCVAEGSVSPERPTSVVRNVKLDPKRSASPKDPKKMKRKSCQLKSSISKPG
ncbi:unnamed protein product [Caenorhabditis auriculariae]|uniref:Uncharacterized protein n=1 Tax=Caenorhabditis auriculariae TaxID=2777116 RepID=A0A8S1HU14_9PELO|nr:unnamed protein product [Caenorhabditis auriculariae]